MGGSAGALACLTALGTCPPRISRITSFTSRGTTTKPTAGRGAPSCARDSTGSRGSCPGRPRIYECKFSLEGEAGRVDIDGKDHGFAPGQYVVFYDGTTCIGSGVIQSMPEPIRVDG